MNRTFRAILPVLLLAFALQSPTLADPPAAAAQSAAVAKLKEAVSKELVA